MKDKFLIAVKTLKSDAYFTYEGNPPSTEEEYNNRFWELWEETEEEREK